MVRRILAFSLTAVMLGAPVATAVCQAMCASADAAQATANRGAAEHHSCHGDAAPAPGVALTAPAHPCGHTDRLPPGLDQARQDPAAPPAIIPAATFTVVFVETGAVAQVHVESSPPSFVALATPLRL